MIYPSIYIHRQVCGGCKKQCSKYEEIKCNKRDKSSGTCNKCPNISKCHLDKYFYYATNAFEEYKTDLIDYRKGINLTTLEVKELASILKPLLDQGQSLYQIKSSHKEINQSLKILYNYIEMGVFNNYGIDNFSLKEQVNCKQFKNKYKKRKEPANYENHKYKDYLKFKEDNPEVPTTKMDTVLNSQSGPYIQTFYFESSRVMIGFIHENKTSESMAKTLATLEFKLGQDLYRKLFSLIFTDRGIEFEKVDLFEFNQENGEFKKLDTIIKVGVGNNKSIYQIKIENNDEIDESITTIYRYINKGYLTTKRINLPYAVKYKKRKHNKKYENSSNKIDRSNHTYLDYLSYIYKHLGIDVWKLDFLGVIKKDNKNILYLFYQICNKS